MAHSVLEDVGLLIDGFDMSGDANAVALSWGNEIQDDTTFGSGGVREKKPGLSGGTFEHQGYWEGGVGLVDDELFAALGIANTEMSIVPDGLTAGNKAFFGSVVQGEYSPGGSVGEIFSFGLSGELDGALVDGILLEYSTQTSTGAGSNIQHGAASAAQIVYAALHVLVVSGTSPTLDVLLESDDSGGFGSAVTRITFAQATGRTAEAQQVVGPITDDFWRVSWTIAGGSPSFLFAVVLGIQ